MDESSQGSVELIEGVEMVTPHGEKLRGTMREEYMQQPCIDIHRVSGGSPGGTLLTTDLMQAHIHPQMVEEFTTHGGTEYYEHHILQEHDLGDADRQLVELQAVVEEPQNLTAPVTVVGEKGEIAAMLSAYIQTTGDITGTHQIIIDSSDRSVKMFQQQRLPSLSSLPPLKKALPNPTIRSRYLRNQHHHALEEEVTLTPMTTHHTLDGTNVIVGQHIVHENAVEGHRLLATTDAEGHTILVEDPITQKILQESANQHRIITHDNQRILVTHDSSMSHNLATSTGGHRIATSINGHRLMDVQSDHTTRYITHQEASVVTTMSGQRLITHPAQVQTQTEMDVAERLLDEESPEHQMLVQEQLIHVVLDQNAQAELGVVVPTPGQRVLLQGPEGWTTLDPAGSCEPETTDHDSRDTTTIVEIQDHQGLIVKHEEIDLAEAMVEEVEGLDGSVDGVAEGSDGEAAVDDGVEDSDYDGEGDMRTSRRSLPHKKRLSKKLRNPRKPQPEPLPKSVHAKCFKCNKCGEQFSTQAAFAAHKVTHNVASKKTLSFSCEICGKMLANQLKFFEHLKAHYEPRSGVLVVDPSNSSNGLVSMENGSAHQKLADGNVNEDTVLKDNTHRGHQHIVQLQPTQHHHPKQEHLQQHNLQAAPEQEATHSPNHHQVPHQHIQRHVPRLLSHQVRRHHDEPMEEEAPHQVVDMHTMVLKVESEKPHSMQQQQHVVQMPQLQNGRMRSVKNEQENLQTIQHHQRTTHHSSQTSRQSSTHQSQSSLQQSVLNSDPPPLVPILPPVSTITGSLNISCHLCGKNFRRQKLLESHLSIAHPKQEDIEQFSDPEDMMEGIREVVEAGEGSDEDSQPVVRLTTLTTHSADSEDKSHCETWYRDDDISATEADLQALQHAENEQHNQGHIQHQANSHQQQASTQLEVAHMCDLCGDAFHSKARLNQHLRVEHMELRQKGKDKTIDDDDDYPKGKKLRRLACNQCDRVFNHRNSLVYHLRSHSGERPHQCEECGKSFFATSALKVHMRLHSGDKPYKCEFCGRNFRQWGDLKYHCTSRHSEEKQYQCEYCGKDFARKYSLIVHRRIHTGEKDYVCEFCQKKFRASSYLQNHRRIHTGEKPHRCEVCDKPFRVRSDMKRHLNTHNRERQRVAGGANANRANKQVEEVDEADVDAPDSQDHTSIHQNIHIHELDNSTTITVMKTDSEGAMEILPDDPSSQGATTISLSAHSTDAGLQYTSDRDPLDTHHRSHSASAQTGQLVYVLPTSYYM